MDSANTKSAGQETRTPSIDPENNKEDENYHSLKDAEDGRVTRLRNGRRRHCSPPSGTVATTRRHWMEVGQPPATAERVYMQTATTQLRVFAQLEAAFGRTLNVRIYGVLILISLIIALTVIIVVTMEMIVASIGGPLHASVKTY
ncbi:hypothetical protein EVAR_80380_1 [Eumeta japonica]|uniref:Uncharacterized protein n=1 Tax=Eumeta variegata TaxID=151549 RepID=A0A4C1VHP8_EUMVA|nr:hypothetical protein EVAR_80380_1 [Eumeta japonica]